MDPVTKYHSLLLQWASRVNCTQRAGRVGRLADGKVYRMVTQDFYETHLPKAIPPEILRAPLDRLVLNSKMLAIDEPPEAILSLALSPPDLKNIESTVWSLKEVILLLFLFSLFLTFFFAVWSSYDKMQRQSDSYGWGYNIFRRSYGTFAFRRDPLKISGVRTHVQLLKGYYNNGSWLFVE